MKEIFKISLYKLNIFNHSFSLKGTCKFFSTENMKIGENYDYHYSEFWAEKHILDFNQLKV